MTKNSLIRNPYPFWGDARHCILLKVLLVNVILVSLRVHLSFLIQVAYLIIFIHIFL